VIKITLTKKAVETAIEEGEKVGMEFIEERRCLNYPK